MLLIIFWRNYGADASEYGISQKGREIQLDRFCLFAGEWLKKYTQLVRQKGAQWVWHFVIYGEVLDYPYVLNNIRHFLQGKEIGKLFHKSYFF